MAAAVYMSRCRCSLVQQRHAAEQGNKGYDFTTTVLRELKPWSVSVSVSDEALAERQIQKASISVLVDPRQQSLIAVRHSPLELTLRLLS